jgi:HAD superfamily hydrolase (TIGR01549 family)
MTKDFAMTKGASLRNPVTGEPGVQAVLFDLDGTLYRQRRLRSLMALEMLTMPLAGPARALGRWRALYEYRLAQEKLRGGAQSGAGRVQVEMAAAASGLTVAEVERLVAEWMMHRPLKYLQFCRVNGLDRLLELFKRAGVRAGVLSDYPAEAKLLALGLAGCFSPVLHAGDPAIGAFKPSPRGYLRACEIWDLSPSDVVYVGDRVNVDATGAAAAGMSCVIVGGARGGPALSNSYVVVSSFERLYRAFDGR